MLSLIDSDIITYMFPYAAQNGYGDDATLKDKDSEKFMYSRIDQFIENVIIGSRCNDYKCFLTGKGNFREKEFPLYKANRRGSVKPLLYEEARQYLQEHHNAIVVQGIEADDALAIEMTSEGDNVVCCSIDKDLDQVPGWHYRWAIMRKGKVTKPERLYYITEEEGLRNLYQQALTGDAADNIMRYFDEESGTWKKEYGLGEATARKLLKDIQGERELHKEVLKKYESWGKTAQDLEDNLHQLYMIRKINPRTGEPVRWKL